MNGTTDGEANFTTDRKGEVAVILIVTSTICVLGVVCVLTQAVCVLYKVPDMNTTLSNAFMHVTDTIIGALIGWCAKTGVQKMLKKNETEITNTPDNPVPTNPQS